MNPLNHPEYILKAEKYFPINLHFKDIEFPVERRNIPKIEKKNSVVISVYSHENKEKYPIFESKNLLK